MRHRALLVPRLEVNEHLVVRFTAVVDLGNHVNAIHCTQIQTPYHTVQLFAGRALEHARDADAGLAGLGFLDFLLLWFLDFLLLWFLDLLLLLLSENGDWGLENVWLY